MRVEKSYLITWEIELDGDSPEEVARLALKIQRDPESSATVFKVWDEDGIDTVIDLLTDQPEATMDFSEALRHLKKGFRVTRAGWNGEDMFLFLVPGSKFVVNRAPLLGIYPEGTEVEYHAHIDMKTAQGYVVPWLASQADLLANDWSLV